MFKKLWKKTKEVATMYTGTFIVVMILNQLLFFGFCLNPICLVAAMPHVLFITVIIGTWLNKKSGWGEKETATKALKKTTKAVSYAAVTTRDSIYELEKSVDKMLAETLAEQKAREVIALQVEFDASLTDFDNTQTKPQFELNKSKRSITKSSESFTEIGFDTEPPSWIYEPPPWTEQEVEQYINRESESAEQFIYSDTNSAYQLIEELNGYGVYSLWYLTHKKNIASIIKMGIFSNQQAYEILSPVDISNKKVQAYRECIEPIFYRKINEYTPTYIKPKNPMLFSKLQIQHDLCWIEISLSVLLQNNFVFTDGNAAAKDTKFYSSVNDLDKLPWDVLNATYWTSFENGKKAKCAEFLIYPLIESKHIIKVHCNNEITLEYLNQLDCYAQISNELFFE